MVFFFKERGCVALSVPIVATPRNHCIGLSRLRPQFRSLTQMDSTCPSLYEGETRLSFAALEGGLLKQPAHSPGGGTPGATESLLTVHGEHYQMLGSCPTFCRRVGAMPRLTMITDVSYLPV